MLYFRIAYKTKITNKLIFIFQIGSADEKTDFFREAPGQVVKTRQGYLAFVPNPLPPDLTWSNKILADLADPHEVHKHVRALDFGLESLNAIPLSIRLVREMDGILMWDVRGK